MEKEDILQETSSAATIYTSTHRSDINYIRENIPCQWSCPVMTDIPGYIDAIYHGDYEKAYAINLSANLFPGVLGRICSRPCEGMCRHGDVDLGESVSICHLKRVAADNRKGNNFHKDPIFPPTGKVIAVVGGGPAGLAAAYYFALLGHRVVVYEAMPEPGGMLLYGIPAFRLPREVIDQEVQNIISLGIDMECNKKIGTDLDIDTLSRKYNAVVLTCGCYLKNELPVQRDAEEGMYRGLDFMMSVNLGKDIHVGKKVFVIGGGFTAMDCARMALRLGAEKISICIRNTEEQLTVTREEIEETKREGIKFLPLVQVKKIIGKGRVEAVEFIRTRLGGIDSRGRRKKIPIEGSEFVKEADTIIEAIGQRPDYDSFFPGGRDKGIFDQRTGRSRIPHLYGAGDFVTGSSTVIEAIGHAMQVALVVDSDLVGKERGRKMIIVEKAYDTHRERSWDFIPRTQMPTLDLEKRFSSPDVEVETGFSPDQGHEEAKRCYLCNLKYEIDINNCIYCRWCMDICPRDCIGLASSIRDNGERLIIEWTNKWNETAGIVIDNSRCIRCGLCLKICPTKCIGVNKTRMVTHFGATEDLIDEG